MTDTPAAPTPRAEPSPDTIALADALPDPKAGPGDVTATLLETLAGCYKRARLARTVPRAPSSSAASVGTLTHRVLELAGRLRLHRMVEAPKAGIRELRKILDELLAQGTCPAGEYDAVEHVLSMNTPVDFSHLSAVEQPFEVVLENETFTRASGTFDRVDLRHDLGGGLRKAVVVDYKSGHVRDAATLRREPQTLLYLIAARLAWPDPAVRIELRYEFLSYGETVTVPWSEDLDSWGRTYVARVADLWLRGHKDAKPGEQCGKCPYSQLCEEGTRWLARQKKRTESLDRWQSAEALASEYREVSEAMKGLRGYRGRLGRTLMELLDPHTGKLEAGKWLARRRGTTKTAYEASALREVHASMTRELTAKGDGAQATTFEAFVRRATRVVPSKIRALVADLPESKARLEDFRSLDQAAWVEVVGRKP